MEALKAFISYSHADESHKNRLTQFLIMLKRNGVVDSWNDRMLLAGDKLDAEIENNLLAADLVILLVSQDFLSSYYCYEIELTKALQKANEDGSRVIAVIVDHCTWKDTPLSQFVLLPKDAKPVVTFENPNEAWLGISESIKDVCRDVKKKDLVVLQEDEAIDEGELIESFSEYLVENEIVLQHRAKEEVGLSDVYIAPDLRLLDDEPEKFDSIVSSTKLVSPFSCPKKIVVIGEEQSGKSSLVKEIFKGHHSKGRFPVLIKGEDIRSADIGEIVREAKARQYKTTNVTLSTIIIEEIEQARLNARYLPVLLQRLLALNETVVFVSGRELRFNEMTWRELAEADGFEILPFGHVLRGELINKWNSLGQEETIDLCELHAANDRVTHHIDSLLRKNVVPPKPVFILMILQTLESNSPSDFSLTAYGHCYNALIQQSLRKSKIKSDQIDRHINYLTELSYFIFKLEKTKATEDEINVFKAQYSDKYLIDSHERVIEDLKRSGLLRVDSLGVSFTYKYIFYFYTAKYIAENYGELGAGDVSGLCEKMHSEKHANILIFLTYHTKDQKILDEILSFAESIFPDEKPATLESSDTEHFEDILKSIPALAMELRSAQEIEEERKSNLNRKDQIEKHVVVDDDDDDLIETHTFADINRSAKAVEIIGQILRNRHASLKIDQLNSLSKTSFLTGLRFLSFYFKITKSLKSEIVEEITKIIQGQASLTDVEVTDQARKLFFQFCYSMSFSVIKKISFSTGNDQLIQLFRKIADELDTPAVHLISLCIQLEFTKKINRDYILEVKKKMDKSSISYRLMQEIVMQHLYLHNIDYNDRQWLSSKLDIPMKEQRILQNQRQTKILS
ncbi:toll/interleukin-1 receptor domain-containing protein [Pseudomonas sp. MOB-449]|nr:toll/interleukin-1 receptor domain-containing protein [Pseudomonas sp. MOB-449]